MDMVFFSPMGSEPADSDRIWPHADIDTNEAQVRDWDVYQSVLAVWPLLSPGNSCTVVWPGSHKDIYDKLIESAKSSGHAGG